MLKDKLQQMDAPQPMLVQGVSAGWNSIYDMLCWLLEQRWPITATLSDPTVTQQGEHHLI